MRGGPDPGQQGALVVEHVQGAVGRGLDLRGRRWREALQGQQDDLGGGNEDHSRVVECHARTKEGATANMSLARTGSEVSTLQTHASRTTLECKGVGMLE